MRIKFRGKIRTLRLNKNCLVLIKKKSVVGKKKTSSTDYEKDVKLKMRELKRKNQVTQLVCHKYEVK